MKTLAVKKMICTSPQKCFDRKHIQIVFFYNYPIVPYQSGRDNIFKFKFYNLKYHQ